MSYGHVLLSENLLIHEFTKSNVCRSEKSIDLLEILIGVYCPLDGIVLDSNGGTTAIAALLCEPGLFQSRNIQLGRSGS